MHDVAATAPQPLAPDEQRHRARLLREARGERHRVGRPAEERCPHAHAVGRHLVRQQAHRFAATQRAHHRSHTGERGRCGGETGALARGIDERPQPRLARRAIEHGDGPVALGIGLRGDLEAAHVGRQKNDASARRVRSIDQRVTVPAHARQDALRCRSHPKIRQLHQQSPGLGNRGPRSVTRDSCLRHVGVEALPIRRRQRVAHPPQPGTQRVKKPHRPA